ncbi:MAG: TIM barrel protein [Bryobacteraceae bacterium]|jgi:sugar phosphate isomerase/epimerase
MKLGIGTYCYTWAHGIEGGPRPQHPLSAFGLLDRCMELGVRVVQFGPNLALDGVDLEALAEKARAAGIEMEAGVTGLDAESIRRGVELCRRLGARLLRTIDSYDAPPRSTEELERFLREALRIVEPACIRLAVENSRTPARRMAKALEAVGSPLLGVTLDTVNSLAIPEGTEEVVSALAPHTLCVHVKDFRVSRIWHRMGFVVEGAPAGSGQLDTAWLLDCVRETGRDPNVILELWVPEQPTLEETVALEDAWVRQSIAFLRKLVSQ